MSGDVLRRQYILDPNGVKIGVILPIAELEKLERALKESLSEEEIDPIAQLKQAVHDPLFMADLKETMAAFSPTDTDGWEAE